jgi:hypothetical protein
MKEQHATGKKQRTPINNAHIDEGTWTGIMEHRQLRGKPWSATFHYLVEFKPGTRPQGLRLPGAPLVPCLASTLATTPTCDIKESIVLACMTVVRLPSGLVLVGSFHCLLASKQHTCGSSRPSIAVRTEDKLKWVLFHQ